MANIQKRPNGTWRARYRDSAGKEHARHFARRVDAQAWLDGVTTAVQTGAYVDPVRARKTVGELSEQWFVGKVNLKPSTQALYESILSTHILPRWRDVPLTRVEHGDVQTWVAGLVASGLSFSTTIWTLWPTDWTRSFAPRADFLRTPCGLRAVSRPCRLRLKCLQPSRNGPTEGGRYWDRTSDRSGVSRVLSR